jgi:MoaA/NifB/PqqE/SkfB family radical SAM enzyme
MPFSGFDPPLEGLLDLFKRTRDEVDPFEVVISGGEPFVRGDVMTLLEGAARILGDIGVTTNGTRLASLRAEDLAVLRTISGKKGRLQVSLDSVAPSVNNPLRGGTAAVLEGLDALESAAVPFCVGIVVTKTNLESLPDTLEFVLRRYKLMRGIAFMNLMPSEVLGLSWPQLAAGADQYKSACDVAARATGDLGRSDIKIYTDRQNEHVPSVIDGYGIPYCLAGLMKLEVLPNGDVTPCSMIRSVTLGNLYRESWPDIWARSLERLQRLSEDGVVGAQCAHFNRRDLVQIHETISPT